MNQLELIDRLCSVTSMMSDVIREQAFFIENCKTIDEATKQKFAELRKDSETELDLIELHLRPYHNTGCGKE